MNEKIDADLFACLMQMSAAARSDLLEFIGQGPVLARALPVRVMDPRAPGRSTTDARRIADRDTGTSS